MDDKQLARHMVRKRDHLRDRTGNEMPYLLDIRGAGANVELRNEIINRMMAELHGRNICSVIGVANSGLIWGAWLAGGLRVPYGTVLPDGPRESGLQRSVEGELPQGSVVLVDNWIITGDSVGRAIAAISRESPGLTIDSILLVARPKAVPDLGVPILSAVDAESLYELKRE